MRTRPSLRFIGFLASTLASALFASPTGCTVIHSENCGRPGAWEPDRPCFRHEDCFDLGGVCDFGTHLCIRSRADAGFRVDTGVWGDGASADASTPDDAPDAPDAPVRCERREDCAAGQVCTAGECRAAGEVCQFNFECAVGHECVDGRCLRVCNPATPSAGACATTQRCESDGYCRTPDGPTGPCAGGCAAGQRCVNAVCVASCVVDAECGASALRCLAGACVPDDRRAPPFCESDAQCAVGSVCRAGVCRAACPSGTDEECQRRDVNFDRCGAERLCVSSNELAPACALSVDCRAGQTCIDARCR